MNIKNLIPWSSDEDKFMMESPFGSLEREMNRVFRNFTKNFFDDTPLRSEWMARAGTLPKVDITETEDEVQVTAELPGMEEKDIELSLSDNVLELKGEKKQEKEEKQKNFYRMERTFGKFQRRIPLPSEIRTDKVEAAFRNGVLTVRLPKTEKAKKEVRKITIKTD